RQTGSTVPAARPRGFVKLLLPACRNLKRESSNSLRPQRRSEQRFLNRLKAAKLSSRQRRQTRNDRLDKTLRAKAKKGETAYASLSATRSGSNMLQMIARHYRLR